jgi:hypothetical protein
VGADEEDADDAAGKPARDVHTAATGTALHASLPSLRSRSHWNLALVNFSC